MGVAQFAPFSFSPIFSRKKKKMMAGMNKRETLEDFRQSPHIHGQSLAEHKDAFLLASTRESLLRIWIVIYPKSMFPDLCCTFLFCTVVDQAAELGHFHQKLWLTARSPLQKPTKSPANFARKFAPMELLPSDFREWTSRLCNFSLIRSKPKYNQEVFFSSAKY